MAKPVTCNFEIAYHGPPYHGAQLNASGSSVSCSLAGGLRNTKISKKYEFGFTVGDVDSDQGINVKVAFKLFKKRRDPPTLMRTLLKTFTASKFDMGAGDHPSVLGCPQENTFIYSISNSFFMTKVNSWQLCAQLCYEFRNEAGNAPCFSWVYTAVLFLPLVFAISPLGKPITVDCSCVGCMCTRLEIRWFFFY